MYRIKAIILNITHFPNGQIRFILLTQDYGKITAWWKKRTLFGVDMGDIVEVIISRKTQKNTIKSLDVILSWWPKGISYKTAYAFLDTLRIIDEVTMPNEECKDIYDDTHGLIFIAHSSILCVEQYSIFQMRILRRIGSMDGHFFTSCPILKYVYNNISHVPLSKVVHTKKLESHQIRAIQKANLHSLYLLKA